jgi:hypothetical protein
MASASRHFIPSAPRTGTRVRWLGIRVRTRPLPEPREIDAERLADTAQRVFDLAVHSVHDRVFVHPREGREFEALVRYMMRPPVSLSRLRFTSGSHEVVYAPKAAHDESEAEPSSPHEASEDAAIPDGPYRAALRRRWAELIRRVYEVDPLICPRCGSEMRVIGFITQPVLIDLILDHLRRRDKFPRPLATPA